MNGKMIGPPLIVAALAAASALTGCSSTEPEMRPTGPPLVHDAQMQQQAATKNCKTWIQPERDYCESGFNVGAAAAWNKGGGEWLSATDLELFAKSIKEQVGGGDTLQTFVHGGMKAGAAWARDHRWSQS